LTEELIAHLGYVGIALVLILGGLGLPIPEEAPIILAAVLSRNGKMMAPLAFGSCLAGVLLGDIVVYSLGFFQGERVLSLPITRKLLTRAREAQIKGYFHRHGFKILILGRFAVGFRTAAYLTAGILKLPPMKLFLTDLVAATLSTSLMFGLGYVFAHQIQSGIQELQHWLMVLLTAGILAWLFYRYYRARQRAGLPVGPPVPIDDVPLPADDRKTRPEGPSSPSPRRPEPASASLEETAGLGLGVVPKNPAGAPSPAPIPNPNSAAAPDPAVAPNPAPIPNPNPAPIPDPNPAAVPPRDAPAPRGHEGGEAPGTRRAEPALRPPETGDLRGSGGSPPHPETADLRGSGGSPPHREGVSASEALPSRLDRSHAS
jgi:membrane protein DedA with SNARE-associated domain